MLRKMMQSISVIELLLAVAVYFLIAYHFDHDMMIATILPQTGYKATLLRLSIYIIPGLNLICGIFGIVFSTKGLLCLTGLMEIASGALTLYFKGASILMQQMGIVMIVLGVVYILAVILIFVRKS